MADVATIALRVNTSELEKGTQELDKFGSAAGVAAKSADGLGSDIDEVHKRVAEFRKRLEESTSAARNNGKAQDALAESFMKQIDSIKTAGDATERLASISASLRAARRAGNIDEQNYLSLISDIARKQSEVTKTEQATAAAREIFVKKLKDQVATQKLSREELLRYRATQLGVSSTAEIYIQTLEKSNTGTQKLGRTSAAASRNIRTLATQMSRLTFGGLGGTGASLLGNLGLLTGPVGAATAALTLLGKAYYQGEQESSAFNKALILTGNYSGSTAGQLNQIAKSLSGVRGTQSAAASALAQIASTGKFTAEQLKIVGEAAIAMQETTGKSVSETVSDFDRLYRDPAKASAELNEQYHYLTAAQYDYIASLERRGATEEAGEAAAKYYAVATKQRADQIVENLGYIERMIKSGVNTWKQWWDAALNIGRPVTQLDKLQAELNNVNDVIEKTRASREQYGGLSILSEKTLNAQIAKSKELQTTINFIKKSQEGYQKSQQEGIKTNEEAISATQLLNSWLDSGTTKTEKRIKAQNELTKAIEANRKAAQATQARPEGERVQLMSDADIAKARASIDNFYKEVTTKATDAKRITDDLATRELASSQQRLAALREQETATSKLTSQEQQLVKFNQQIADLKEKSILTADQKSLIAREGELRASLQLEVSAASIASAHQTATEALEAMQRYTVDIAQRNDQAAQSHGKTAKEVQKLAQLRQLEITYLKQKKAIVDAINKAEASGAAAEDIARLRQELELLTAAWKEAEGVIEQGQADAAKRSMDWGAGIVSGIDQWTTSATDMYSNMQGAATFALDAISGSLTELVTTGKADFKEMTVSILKYLTEIMVKMAIAGAMKSAFGFSDGGYVPFANGGFVGPATAMKNGYAGGGFTGNGGKYQPKGIVHGGEFVFTKEATKALGINQLYSLMHAAEGRGYADGGFVGSAPMVGFSGGAGGLSVTLGDVNLNIESAGGAGDVSAGNTAEAAKQLQGIINKTIVDWAKKATSPGGLLYKR